MASVFECFIIFPTNSFFQMLSHQSHGEGISPPSKHDEVVENERLSAEGKEETAMVSDGGVASPSLPLWSFSSVRLTIAIALALSLAIEGLMRSNINMAMVCMVNKTAISLMTPHSDHQHKFFDNASLTSTSPRQMAECVHMAKQFKNLTKLFDDGDLIISKREQSLIFTSFYLGGLLIILPGSFLCDWLGPTRLVFYGALLNVFGTFSTPFVARHFGSVALLVVRFLMGCGQGILVPCVNVLIAHWFPLSEKSTAIAISTTGNQISVVLAMFITAELCVAQSLGGWASSFYIYGVIGAAFCAIWLLLVRDYPFQSKRIRSDELRLIETHGGRAKGLQKINPNDVPWRHILGSMVVWSTGFSSFSQNFMNVGIVVYLPTYYHDVLGMNLASNGLMSALPFIVQLLTKILFAGIADWLKERRLMSSSAVTKLFNLVASFGSGLCFVLLSFCDCRTPYLAISLAICAIGISSGFIPGYNTSVVCIAPLYISSIASFSRLLGQIASVVSPYGIGIVVANGSKVAWQFAFCGMAAILFSTGVIFQCFGSASVQEWAIIPPAVDPSHEAPYHLVKLDADNENEEEKRKEQNVVGEESK